VNLPFFTGPNGNILLHGDFLGLKSISTTSRVKACNQFEKNEFLDQIDVGHETLNCICNDDFKTNIDIPLRHVVIEWTLEDFKEFLWVMLTQVSIHNQNDEPSVEELSNECTSNHLSFLL